MARWMYLAGSCYKGLELSRVAQAGDTSSGIMTVQVIVETIVVVTPQAK